MRISDLPAPVTASKADWLAGTTWLGFTPTEENPGAHAQCQSTIQSQFRNGYVIEYITKRMGDPNPGFQNHPAYLVEKASHQELAGNLIAVHRLRHTARKLETIIGHDEYKLLQDRWAQDGKRYRWSVAFPIVESYRIVDQPDAKSVFGELAYKRLYGHSSGTLRPLTDDERMSIANLNISPVVATNAWIGIEDEFEHAKRSEIDSRIRALIDRDLNDRVLEGIQIEHRSLVRKRAAWLADKFIRKRIRSGTMHCDDCGFIPSTRVDYAIVKPRSLLDVHHKNPLDEGKRYTGVEDFTLYCPTCHRIAHALINAERRR
jgi:5-methylcytosine-specific restriction protein A